MNDHTASPAIPRDSLTARERLCAAVAMLTPDWAPVADFLPQDAPIVDAWSIARALCANDRAGAIHHLDRFLSAHDAALRDLAWRARHRSGPTPLLDDIARTLAIVIDIPVTA